MLSWWFTGRQLFCRKSLAFLKDWRSYLVINLIYYHRFQPTGNWHCVIQRGYSFNIRSSTKIRYERRRSHSWIISISFFISIKELTASFVIATFVAEIALILTCFVTYILVVRMDVSRFSEMTLKGQKKLATTLCIQVSILQRILSLTTPL